MSASVIPQERMPGDRLLRPGNTNCAGCGMSLGLHMIEQALEGEVPMLVIPACCGIVTAGAFPTTAFGAPVAASTFASAAAVKALVFDAIAKSVRSSTAALVPSSRTP